MRTECNLCFSMASCLVVVIQMVYVPTAIEVQFLPVAVRPDSDAEMRGGGTEEKEGQAGGCGLSGNLDILTCRADWLYHSGAHQVQ